MADIYAASALISFRSFIMSQRHLTAKLTFNVTTAKIVDSDVTSACQEI